MSRKRWQFLFALLCALLYLFAGVAFGDTLTVDGEDIEVWKVSDGFYQDGATYAASTNFYITGKKGLIYFRDFVNGLQGDFDHSSYPFLGKTVNLLTDVAFEDDEDWIPIGYCGDEDATTDPRIGPSGKRTFTGIFDGKNHTVSNLHFTTTLGENYFVGFFGYLYNNENMRIKNLKIKDVNFSSTGAGSKFSKACVGAVVGAIYNKQIIIENCHVSGNIQLSGTTSVGGIAGLAWTTDNCSVAGDDGSLIYSDLHAGGLLGYGAYPSGPLSTILSGDDSVATVSGVTVSSDYWAGSIVGFAYSTIALNNNVTVGDNVVLKQDGEDVTLRVGNTEAQIVGDEYTTMGYISGAVNAASTDQTVEIVAPSNSYTLPTVPTRVTIEGKVDGVTFSHTGGGDIASVANGVTFRNVSFDFGGNDYHGFWNSDNLTFENCNLIGKLFSYHSLKFNDCKFINNSGDYNMWCYGGNNATSLVEYHNCDFTSSKGKFLNIYSESAGPTYHHNVIVDGCSFTNTNEAASKAALNIKETVGTALLAYDVKIIGDNTLVGPFPASTDIYAKPLVGGYGVYQVDDRTANVDDTLLSVSADCTVTVGEVKNVVKEVYPVRVAKIGETEYNSLTGASAAATSGDTIELLSDIELFDRVWLTSGVTLDGKGYTIKPISADGSKFNDERLITDRGYAASASLTLINLAADVTNVTIKNVSIDSAQLYPRALIGTAANTSLTLSDVVLNHNSTTIRGADALALNGNCKITGSFKVALGERSWSAISFNHDNESLDLRECTSFIISEDNRTGTQPVIIAYTDGSIV
ncbi:MAG: hypothetical protein IJP91_03405, partial [Synergistaceae bacterium]|nr:hypothetical protein [Synergistaceae bacterium]